MDDQGYSTTNTAALKHQPSCSVPQHTASPRPYLSVGSQRAQVAFQVPMCHQLHDHQRGLALGDHPEEANLRAKKFCQGCVRAQGAEPSCENRGENKASVQKSLQQHPRLSCTSDRAKGNDAKRLVCFIKSDMENPSSLHQLLLQKGCFCNQNIKLSKHGRNIKGWGSHLPPSEPPATLTT